MQHEYALEVRKGGRITIPIHVREHFGLNEGDKLVMHIDDEDIRLQTQQQALDEARALIHQHTNGKGLGSVEDFLRERREEAKREDAKLGRFDAQS